MSQSITATRWPCAASAAARLTVTDDLPTPPLPEATASTRVVDDSPQKVIFFCCCSWPPRRRVTRAPRCSSVMVPILTATCSTPGSGCTALVTSVVMRSRRGQPAMVSSTSTVTTPPSIDTLLTMSSSVIGLWISGSITCPRAATTSSPVTLGTLPSQGTAWGSSRLTPTLPASVATAHSQAGLRSGGRGGGTDVGGLRRDRRRWRAERAGGGRAAGRGGLGGVPAGGKRPHRRRRCHDRVDPARLQARLRRGVLPHGRAVARPRRPRPGPLRAALRARAAGGRAPVPRQPRDRARRGGGGDRRLDRQGPPRRRCRLGRPRPRLRRRPGGVPARPDGALAAGG